MKFYIITILTLLVSCIGFAQPTGKFGGGDGNGFGSATALDQLLPMELLSFAARVEDRQVVLEWETTLNSTGHFELERSKNGLEFTLLNRIATNTRGKYQENDEKPLLGLSYYRLKMVDEREEVSYSQILAVKINEIGGIKVFPNPVKDVAHIQLPEGMNRATLKVVNLLGKIVYSTEIQAVNSLYRLDFSPLGLPNGQYFIYVNDGNREFSYKVYCSDVDFSR